MAQKYLFLHRTQVNYVSVDTTRNERAEDCSYLRVPKQPRLKIVRRGKAYTVAFLPDSSVELCCMFMTAETTTSEKLQQTAAITSFSVYNENTDVENV